MNPNILLTTPIASSTNLSGLNIDVGNLMPTTPRTWLIPNTSVTPIPLNPTHTQMHVSEGPGSTPEISSKANPQSKFLHYFFLNPFWNPVVSQEPFGQSKQPTLTITSGSQAHVGDEKQIWHLKASWSDLRSQSKIVKFTGRHHPYASKPRTAHASSSRGKIVDDEDENMSPNNSEANYEPRRDDFMAHEEGTQSNSEFNHQQMCLAKSMLEQSKIRQQRSQACKAHNVAKCASQKDQQGWLKAELP
ncbi:hypothetical protein O181_029607 [Austropuccinia psidii MF-1]|uniref:Uncharacterized protein n=1 Tax=Austropuccinia psidii MF-1 TaxID=1389203 RepID=A0A9Q3CU44_9BASI|nr:hypothetical protein [Austropuccinia psidii MF-1]